MSSFFFLSLSLSLSLSFVCSFGRTAAHLFIIGIVEVDKKFLPFTDFTGKFHYFYHFTGKFKTR